MERGGGGAAVAWAQWRNEAGRGGKQNPATWQIGRPNALKVGLEEWGRKEKMSQGLAVWVLVEIQAWRTTCSLPELCYRKACFQRLNPTDQGSRTGRDETEGRKEWNKESCKQKGRQQGKREKGGRNRRSRKEKEQVKQQKFRVKPAVLYRSSTVSVSIKLAVSSVLAVW